MADRAVAPVVGKALELGLVLLVVGTLATGLYGGAVPEYRTAAADRVADRALAGATHDVESALAAAAHGRRGRVALRLRLPSAVRGEPFRLRTDGRALVLSHPHPDVGGRVRLNTAAATLRLRGSVSSTERAVVLVTWNRTTATVRLGGRP
ncbi:MAG: hypothetical protein ABEJ42_10425 [Halobacteriaceae archaeon]